MKRYDIGLVVGKFAPLHRGHQFLLDQAGRMSNRLIVISYTNPEFPGCLPDQRECWLQSLYPHATALVLDDARLAKWCSDNVVDQVRLPPNDAPDDIHRRFVGWVLKDILNIRVDAVFTSEAYGEGFANILDQMQGHSPPVVHVEVDAERASIPVVIPPQSS